MNIKLLFKLLVVFSLAFSFVAIAKDVKVKGYYKKNGTYVKPHYRSAPDSSINNNWTTRGNVNPHTGADGTRARQYEWDSGSTSYSDESNSYNGDVYDDTHYSGMNNHMDHPYYQSEYNEVESVVNSIGDEALAEGALNSKPAKNSSNTSTKQNDESDQYMGDVYDGTYDLDEYNHTENPYYQSEYIETEGTIDLISDKELPKVSLRDNQIDNNYAIKATGLFITIITLLIFGFAISKGK